MVMHNRITVGELVKAIQKDKQSRQAFRAVKFSFCARLKWENNQARMKKLTAITNMSVKVTSGPFNLAILRN